MYWLLKENSIPFVQSNPLWFLCNMYYECFVWFFVERGNFIVYEIFKPLAGRGACWFVCLFWTQWSLVHLYSPPPFSLTFSRFSPLFFHSLVTKTQRQACLYIVSNYLLSFILSVPLPGPLKMKWEGRSHCIAAPTAETLLPTNPTY